MLDTNSQDNTVQIARDWGCIVEEAGDKFSHPISEDLAKQINERFLEGGEDAVVKEGDKYFDFASARNASSALASNNMVSFVDADEEMTSLDIDAISKYIDEGFTQFEYDFVFAHKPDGSPAVEFRQSKFYDKSIAQWRGIVHEYIDGPLTRHKLTIPEFRLEHWQIPGDRHSYLKGLAVDCFNNQGSDRNSHYFARELLWSGRPQSAIKEFKRHIAMGGWPAERAQSMIFISDCLLQIGQDAEALDWLFRAYHLDPQRRAALIKLAQYYASHNNPHAAAAFAHASLVLPWTDYYANDRAHYEFLPHEILFNALGWMGDIGGAQKHLNECLRYQPYNPHYLGATKYFFPYYDKAIEGYMRWPELMFLYETAQKMDNVVEVGSWMGRSTDALLSGCKGTVTAVDTFAGSDDSGDATNWIAKEKDIYAEFMKNVGHYPNLEVMKMTSEAAAGLIPDKSVDCVFIDALHTYEGVKKDIELWRNKPTKILCGHDFDERAWPGVCAAVRELLGEPHGVADSIWWFDVTKM